MRIQLQNISHDYAGTPVLTGINADVTPGCSIGIVGANGCGKTTLARIISGELEPASGTVGGREAVRVGYVPQTVELGSASTVGDYVLSDILGLRSRLRELEKEMSEADAGLDRVLADYARVREHYDAANGDTAEETARRLLGELGLGVSLDQELATLSGGEQNVLALGRAVVSRPDLLILDEPGNHLDFQGLAWLETYLRRYPGALCIISHNRYLLDRVVTEIWEIQGGRLASWSGNYSDYRFARLSQALSDQATYTAQQHKLARLEELVRTFEERARVTGDPKWGKRLRARRTQLRKSREAAMEEPDTGTTELEISFRRTNVKSDIAVRINGYEKQFGERILFNEARLTVHAGERVGIVGPNGSGKTTLIEELVAEGSWEHPVLQVGPSMRIGYCAQKRGRFPAGTTVLDAALKAGSPSRREVHSVLSRLRFAWDDLDRAVDSLSGGEWNRLQLGIAILAEANLLVLDEPTNHLDIPSREAVEEALTNFDGTIIAVSHDRYFLDAVAERIVELTNHRLVPFEGSFTRFWYERARPEPARATSSGAAHRRSRADAGDSGTAEIERQIMQLEARRDELESRMNESFARGNYREGRRHGAELAKLRDRIEELYARWGT